MNEQIHVLSAQPQGKTVVRFQNIVHADQLFNISTVRLGCQQSRKDFSDGRVIRRSRNNGYQVMQWFLMHAHPTAIIYKIIKLKTQILPVYIWIRGVNEPERTGTAGTAFRLEFVQAERRSCSIDETYCRKFRSPSSPEFKFSLNQVLIWCRS